ncbi:MAG: NUDIX hydrolase [Leptospiraceae bacterium]|nr:NUDIX hydrolase [Leptospiraceae bacterium]MDW8305723.1 NUDIX hydrolase [Leptospiraceae bacterium]
MRKRQITDKILYTGHDISFAVISTPQGERPLVYYPEAAAILAVQNEHLIMVEQFRYGSDCYSLEIPAGKKDPQEDILSCAQRELREETGYVAKHWELLFCYYPAISIMTEKLCLFLAKELSYVGESPDPDEILTTKMVSFQKAQELFMQGQIIDSKTIIALQYLALNSWQL